MSARRKPVGSGSRGGSSGRPRQGSGLQHQRSYPQPRVYADVQEQNGRLRSQNDALRNQNADLARELNEAKSRLQTSRQRELELERRLLQRNKYVGMSARVPPPIPPPPTDTRVGSRSRPSLGTKKREVLEGAKRQGAEDSNQSRHNREGIPNRRLKNGWDVGQENGHSHLGKAFVRLDGSGKGEPGLPAKIPVSPVSGVCIAGGVHRAGKTANHGDRERENQYLPEEGVFRMDPSDGVDEPSRSDRGQKAPSSSTSSGSSPPQTHPERTIWLAADTSCPTVSGCIQPLSVARSLLCGVESSGSSSIPLEGEGVPVPVGRDRAAFSSQPFSAPSPPSYLSPSPPIEVAPNSSNPRPRRAVARPVSYQEPSLNVKMRKGHVMFPKSKTCVQRTKFSQPGVVAKEKENERGRNHGRQN